MRLPPRVQVYAAQLEVQSLRRGTSLAAAHLQVQAYAAQLEVDPDPAVVWLVPGPRGFSLPEGAELGMAPLRRVFDPISIDMRHSKVGGVGGAGWVGGGGGWLGGCAADVTPSPPASNELPSLQPTCLQLNPRPCRCHLRPPPVQVASTALGGGGRGRTPSGRLALGLAALSPAGQAAGGRGPLAHLRGSPGGSLGAGVSREEELLLQVGLV